MEFINYADTQRIILVVLPSHSTHRLQPLDVGLFSPLSSAYTRQCMKILDDSQGLIRLTKRDFWPLFYAAWKEAFTEKNIRSAFEATSIHPLNSERVLAIIIRPSSPISESSEVLKTPSYARLMRRTYKKL